MQERTNARSSSSFPDFIIIGAQKAGSTSLFSHLSRHSQLRIPRVKEVHFFDGGLEPNTDNFAKGPEWYRAHFSPKTDGQSFKTFEATPLYLFNPRVAERMHALLPAVKLIALLRNPTERALSHYFHERRVNYETLPILDAFQAEEERLQHALVRQDYKSIPFIHHSYKLRGHYKEQLERYFRYFPRKQLLILNSEDFFANPAQSLRKVFEFVGVNAAIPLENLLPVGQAPFREKVPASVYDYLNDYFRPHNLALYAFLGEDYGW